MPKVEKRHFVQPAPINNALQLKVDVAVDQAIGIFGLAKIPQFCGRFGSANDESRLDVSAPCLNM